MGKSRKYIISWNNYPLNLSLKQLQNQIREIGNVEYMILAFEKGEEKQTPHIQGYVRFTNPITFQTLQKILTNDDGTMGYLDQAKGSDNENKIYCSKQGNYIEYGEPKNSQEENKQNLIDIFDDINNMNYVELCKKYYYYVLYHYRDFRTLYEDIKQTKKKETEQEQWNK